MSDYVYRQMQDAPLEYELTESDWAELLDNIMKDEGLQDGGSGQAGLEPADWDVQEGVYGQAQVEPGDKVSV